MAPPPGQGPPFPVERAFVVQFRAEAVPAQGRFVGRVEHVVSGQATYFHTLDTLLTFLGQVLTPEGSHVAHGRVTHHPSPGSVASAAALRPGAGDGRADPT